VSKFTDIKGRAWLIEITVDTVKRVKSLCEVDLLDIVQDRGKLLSQLTDDPITLCNILYVICKDQADEQKVSDEDFGRGLGGDALEQATVAFLEALVNFFPGHKRRVLQKVLDRSAEVQSMATDLIIAKLDDPAIEAHLKARVEKILLTPGDSSGDAPASSD